MNTGQLFSGYEQDSNRHSLLNVIGLKDSVVLFETSIDHISECERRVIEMRLKMEKTDETQTIIDGDIMISSCTSASFVGGIFVVMTTLVRHWYCQNYKNSFNVILPKNTFKNIKRA